MTESPASRATPSPSQPPAPSGAAAPGTPPSPRPCLRGPDFAHVRPCSPGLRPRSPPAPGPRAPLPARPGRSRLPPAGALAEPPKSRRKKEPRKTSPALARRAPRESSAAGVGGTAAAARARGPSPTPARGPVRGGAHPPTLAARAPESWRRPPRCPGPGPGARRPWPRGAPGPGPGPGVRAPNLAALGARRARPAGRTHSPALREAAGMCAVKFGL